jgi:hypothetical protein
MRLATRLAGAIGILAVLATPAAAGPPFVTDDPEPTDTGHWENYAYVTAIGQRDQTDAETGFDLNYGALKDLQLTTIIPVEIDKGAAPALGDIQLAAKYRFIHQSTESPAPDVSFFPAAILPTGKEEHDLGLFLPLWAQKDWGKWSMFGGGGYTIKPGAGNRNSWLTGVALTREVSERLTLGAEIFDQTAQTTRDRAFTGMNLGVIYKATKHWSLLMSGGPNVQGPLAGRQYDLYMSILANY